MKTRRTKLPSMVSGQPLFLDSFSFGEAAIGHSAYIQAGLHADEHPGILVIQHLITMLGEYEEQGKIVGEIVLVPLANPVGMMQNVLGNWAGRFDLSNGENFNRHFPELREKLEKRGLAGETDTALMIQQSLADIEPSDTVGLMKHALFAEALKHDFVLDLHCDTDAVLHLYTNRVHTERARKLAQALGADVIFVEDYAGGQPFDEAVYRVWQWFSDRQMLGSRPLPFSVTVELRGQADVSDVLARQDAEAIIAFLAEEGILLAQPANSAKPERLRIYPLEGASHLQAPVSGILAWRKRPGEPVTPGEHLADIVSVSDGHRTPVYSNVDGVMVARPVMKMIRSGQRVALLAGNDRLEERQDGKLLRHF
ncbi:succinylglutamate desuccinylase/aspartoacylase family protein [Pantoea ananatis]